MRHRDINAFSIKSVNVFVVKNNNSGVLEEDVTWNEKRNLNDKDIQTFKFSRFQQLSSGA